MRGGSFHKPVHHVVGIMAIADNILTAQEHLQPRIRHRGAQGFQPFPRIFFEKTKARVECRTPPDFQRPIADRVQFLGNREHVLGPHPGRQQGLMPVAQGHIRNLKRLGRSRRHLEGRSSWGLAPERLVTRRALLGGSPSNCLASSNRHNLIPGC